MFKRISEKIKHIIKLSYIEKKVYLSNSYSQVGEDSIIAFLFADKGINEITYLDLGTNIPDLSNNTYLFYTRGYRGVCVEADKALIPEIVLKRPADIVIHAGVSTSNSKEADFYILNVNGLSTFDKQEAERRESLLGYRIAEVVKVPLIGINEIINQNFENFPTLLSIDIEGLDLEVLKSLDFSKYPIPVICVETCTFSSNHIRPKDSEIFNFLLSKGYMTYADTYVNTIFVNQKWFNDL